MSMEAMPGTGRRQPKRHDAPIEEPARVTDVQRRIILESDRPERPRERPDDGMPEYRPTPHLRAFAEYSQNQTGEAAMLCNELLRFQKNDLAGPEGISQYRSRLREIQQYLLQLMAYGKQLETSGNLNARDLDRLRHAEEKNEHMWQRIEDTLAESERLQNVRESFAMPSDYLKTIRPKEEPPRQAEQPRPREPEPGRIARAWSFLTSPRKWFGKG